MNLPRAVREHVVLLCNVLKAPTFCAFEGVKTIRSTFIIMFAVYELLCDFLHFFPLHTIHQKHHLPVSFYPPVPLSEISTQELHPFAASHQFRGLPYQPWFSNFTPHHANTHSKQMRLPSHLLLY